MRAHRKSSELWHARLERQSARVRSRPIAPPGKTQIPIPPAIARDLVYLQFLVSSPVADLAAISNLIRNDIGLAVELLRWTGREAIDFASGGLLAIEDLIVLLGLERMRALSQSASCLLAHPKGRAGLITFERFTMHARLTALIAQQLAADTPGVRPEDAYLGGLLRHVGAVPLVLGWNLREFEESESGEIGCRMAKAWSLPEILWPIIGGDRQVCPRSWLSLFDVVSTADVHAFRLEMGWQ